MKTKTLMITLTILAILAGITVTNFAAQQRARRPLPPSVQLTDEEAADILYMREEEKLARDVYLTLSEDWPVPIFTNIGESEQRHMNAIKTLIERYGLTDPIEDDTVGVFPTEYFTNLFDQCVADGSGSLEEALAVGVSIELLDIEDIEKAVEEASMQAVKRVFGNLLEGSKNHLSAFQNAVETGVADCPGQIGTGCGFGPGGACRQDCDGSMTRQGGRRAGNNGNGDGVCLR